MPSAAAFVAAAIAAAAIGAASTANADEVYYKNCDAARDAGDAPVMMKGDPGYGPHLDRDGDGIGCE